jgi:hypothetical protein
MNLRAVAAILFSVALIYVIYRIVKGNRLTCPIGEDSNNKGWCYTGRIIDGKCQVVNCESYAINEASKF